MDHGPDCDCIKPTDFSSIEFELDHDVIECICNPLLLIFVNRPTGLKLARSLSLSGFLSGFIDATQHRNWSNFLLIAADYPAGNAAPY